MHSQQNVTALFRSNAQLGLCASLICEVKLRAMSVAMRSLGWRKHAQYRDMRKALGEYRAHRRSPSLKRTAHAIGEELR